MLKNTSYFFALNQTFIFSVASPNCSEQSSQVYPAWSKHLGPPRPTLGRLLQSHTWSTAPGSSTADFGRSAHGNGAAPCHRTSEWSQLAPAGPLCRAACARLGPAIKCCLGQQVMILADFTTPNQPKRKKLCGRQTLTLLLTMSCSTETLLRYCCLESHVEADKNWLNFISFSTNESI